MNETQTETVLQHSSPSIQAERVPDVISLGCRVRWLYRSAPCRSNILSRAAGPVRVLGFVGLLARLPHMPR